MGSRTTPGSGPLSALETFANVQFRAAKSASYRKVMRFDRALETSHCVQVASGASQVR
jgi:hypothetical protein